MRVITGSARGRSLLTLPGEDVRPTTDRVKEAMFSIIQFEIEGRQVLDLFAGSGQLGIEALSRGAAYAHFIDASKEFVKVTNNNKLSEDNIDNIVNSFVSREDKEYFSRLVAYDEIKENDYNLSVSTYVEAEDTREKIDIVKLNAEIKEIVAREQVLRDEIDKIIAEIEV